MPLEPEALSLPSKISQACMGADKLEVLDAMNMLLATMIVDICEDDGRSNLMRKLDKLLRERVKEIGAREKPRLLLPN